MSVIIYLSVVLYLSVILYLSIVLYLSVFYIFQLFYICQYSIFVSCLLFAGILYFQLFICQVFCIYQDITDTGTIKSCITEIRLMLNTPLKAFHKAETDTPATLNSPGSGGDADNTVQEGDIPGQFTRLMTKGYIPYMVK